MAGLLAALAWGAETKAPREPAVSSVYPLGGQRGTSFSIQVRGKGLEGSRALLWEGTGITAELLESDAEGVRARIRISPEAALEKHSFRVVTPRGVTGRLALAVVADPVVEEAQAGDVLRKFPVVIYGRLGQPGENAAYWLEVAAGTTLTFAANSGGPKFDPALAVYEPTGSWFDPHRLNRIAFNDEPLSFPGLSTDARLTHRFARAGKYCLRVQGFGGEGGPDAVYQLRIVPGVEPAPVLHPEGTPGWEERQFTRVLARDRLTELAHRGGESKQVSAPEVFHAAKEGTTEIPTMSPPGIVEGKIEHAGEAHAIRVRVDKPQDLAIEVETPQATLPRFNPVVRLMEPGGREMATDVYTKLNNNGLYMMKMIEAKTTVSLRAPGIYSMQIRDITTDCGGEDFTYRVLVRPQMPHVGKITLAEDHLNLEAGSSRPLNLQIDREEGFQDYVTAAVEGLPAGVTAMTAIENPQEKPPLPNGGRLERYVAREQRLSVMLVAAPDAPLTEMPARVRVSVRVVHEGRIQEPVAVEEIPVMVIARRES